MMAVTGRANVVDFASSRRLRSEVVRRGALLLIRSSFRPRWSFLFFIFIFFLIYLVLKSSALSAMDPNNRLPRTFDNPGQWTPIPPPPYTNPRGQPCCPCRAEATQEAPHSNLHTHRTTQTQSSCPCYAKALQDSLTPHIIEIESETQIHGQGNIVNPDAAMSGANVANRVMQQMHSRDCLGDGRPVKIKLQCGFKVVGGSNFVVGAQAVYMVPRLIQHGVSGPMDAGSEAAKRKRDEVCILLVGEVVLLKVAD